MKFDVVVSNPPFQAKTSLEKNKQGGLWYVFLLKSIEMTNDRGYVAFISPRSWCGVSFLNTNRFKLITFKKNCPLWVDFDSSSHFPNIGITISSYVLQKGRIGISKVKNLCHTQELDLNSVIALPFVLTPFSISILNKILVKKNKSNYNFTEGSSKNKGVAKVAIIRSRFVLPDKIFVDRTGKTNHTWKSSMPLLKNEIDGAESVFKSKLCQYCFTILGGPLGQSHTGILRNLPFVDLTRTWTDAELYNHFGLDQDEIDEIESSLK